MGFLYWSRPDRTNVTKFSKVKSTLKNIPQDSTQFLWHDTVIKCKECFGYLYSSFCLTKTGKTLRNKDLGVDSKIHNDVFRRTKMVLLLFYVYV